MDGGHIYEIRIGRVLMMCPGYLHGAGAERHCLDGVNPLGGMSSHYFLCIGVVGDHSFWCPLSSNIKPNGSKFQGKISKMYKDGYPHFTNTDSWYDKGQIWKIKNATVQHYAGMYNNHNAEKKDGNLNAVTPVIAEAIFADLYKDFGIKAECSPEILGKARAMIYDK